MARWQPFDVVGGAYSDDTRPWTVQDTVNYLVVNAEHPGGRSSKMLRGVPGMVTFSASMPESSVRGLYVAEGRLFAVVGTTLYRIATDGSAASLGTIPGVGRCVFTHNQVSGGNQVVIGNGQSGYVFNTTDDTLTQITDEGFPGFRSVDFADQYIIGVEPFGRYWFHSDLADATSYSTLDRAEAEKAPDRIQQAIATGSDILVLGERTGQFFYNTGEATGTFQNRSGAEMDVGAGSPYTACRLDNTVYWLGNDGSVYRLNGYVPQRISTHALEQAISRCTLSDAYAFTFEDRGHKCYLLTFPDGQTWCFDAATQEWTRRESYGFNRWRISALVKWRGKWIAGDFINGKLYQLDWAVQQEAGEPLERRRITGVLHDDQNRMIVNAVEFVFDTGMDEDSPPLPDLMIVPLSIAGDIPDGAAGETVSYQYMARGGTPPYTSYAITAGSLPTGLSLNASSGLVTGVRSGSGFFAWTITVTDTDGATASVNDSSTTTSDADMVVSGNVTLRAILAEAIKFAAADGDNNATDIRANGEWVLAMAEFTLGNGTAGTGTIKSYTNGTLQGTTATYDSQRPQDITLGASIWDSIVPGVSPLNGRLWGAGVANGELTDAERTYLYNGGAGRKFSEIAASADANAVSLWAKMVYAWQLDDADPSSGWLDAKGNKSLTVALGTVGQVIDSQRGRCANFARAGRLQAVGSHAQGLESAVKVTYFVWARLDVESTDTNGGHLIGRHFASADTTASARMQGIRAYWKAP